MSSHSIVTMIDLSSSAMLGYGAAALVFMTFTFKSMTALRSMAIASNVMFIAYALSAGLQPVLLLHAALLPMNLLRLIECLRERKERRHHKFFLSSWQFISHIFLINTGRKA